MRKKGSSFFDKIRFKYKIFILNENTLEETFHFRLSQLSLFLFVCIFTLISFVLISVIIFATPLKHFLPGYADVSTKKDLIAETIRIDSLSRSVELQMKQLNVMKNVIDGRLSIDTLGSADSVTVASWADLPLGRSREEEEFAERFEEESKYNLSAINFASPEEAAYKTVLIKPVEGSVSGAYGADAGVHGVEISARLKSAVVAVADGRVIVAERGGWNGSVVSIMYDNGFVSVYRNAGELLKRVNDRVSAGDVVAITDAAGGDGTVSKVSFELWKNGASLNPSEYIVF